MAVRSSLKSIFAAATAAILALGVLTGAQAASPPVPEDLVIQRLEASGALDRAVERGIVRFIQRKEAAQVSQRQTEDAEMAKLAVNARAVAPATDHIFGPVDAPVSIIVYDDFECPYCQQFVGRPEAAVKALAGKANFVLRNFPLSFHDPVATQEARAAECSNLLAGTAVYWKFANGIFAATASNKRGMPRKNGVDGLTALAKELGINEAEFAKCIASPESAGLVASDIRDGIKAGIRGTPGIIVRNNRTGAARTSAGAVSADVLEALAREVLGK